MSKRTRNRDNGALTHWSSSERPRIRKLVAERDKWICWLCGEPVDPALQGKGEDGSPSLDHVVPRGQGGARGLQNVRLAHLRCNNDRNHRAQTESAA